MNKNYFVTSASPFVRTVNKTNFIMLHVIIALLPSLICASITLGSRVIVFALLNVFWCVLFELSANIIFKKQATIGDLSAVVSGLILTMLTPVGVSYWFTVASAFLAMFVAKFLFGGIGKNIFYPPIKVDSTNTSISSPLTPAIVLTVPTVRPIIATDAPESMIVLPTLVSRCPSF